MESNITTTFDLSPRSLDEAIRFADLLSKSSIIPKDFVGNPGNILVAVQWGMELGLKPLQAMQSIAVINGRPALWGDAVIALVRSNPLCEYVYESVENGVATCRVKRKGEEEQVRTFTEAEAKQAGLLGKPGPWTQYRNRMLQLRARAFALRDVFPDVLRGMPMAEEIQDYATEKDVTPANVTDLMPKAKPAPVSAIEQQESVPMPQPTKPRQPDQAERQAPAPQAEAPRRLTQGQVNVLRAKLARASIPEQEVCETFKVDCLESLDLGQFNQAVDLARQASA